MDNMAEVYTMHLNVSHYPPGIHSFDGRATLGVVRIPGLKHNELATVIKMYRSSGLAAMILRDVLKPV